MTDSALREQYDRMDFKMVEATPKLDVPSCTPAWFDYADNPDITDAAEIKRRLKESELSFWDMLAENGELHQFSVSARVTDEEANSRCNVSLSSGGGVSILTKDDEFSFKSFKRVVEVLEGAVGTGLEPCTDP